MLPDHSTPPQEIRCENVTDEIIASYAEQGYIQAFAEEVMRYDLSQALPHVALPIEVAYAVWEPERMHDFFRIYHASFCERPGFPDWSEAKWIDWTANDPSFRSDLSMLAIVQEQVVGFVTNAEDGEAQQGYLIQIGVHPQWRAQGLGAALLARSLQAWREAGREAVILHVNINNPGAIHLFQQLGFVTIARRGKFSRRAMEH